jgi:hypothetical protein
MKVTDFTPADVQVLVRHAESAPLQNMAHAEAVSKLTRKFAEWYAVTQEQDKLFQKWADSAELPDILP